MNTVLHYAGVGFVALDAPAEGPAGGFKFVPQAADALRFNPLSASAFLTEGPGWAVDLNTRGLLSMKEYAR